MKKIISMFLSICLVFSLTVPSFAYGFKDTENTMNEEAIDALSTLEIISGVGNNEFDPTGYLTRGQICSMLVKALYKDNLYAPYEQIFEDVPAQHPFNRVINTAYRYGLVSGYGDGNFGPEDKITYVQLSSILLNALHYNVSNFKWPIGVIEQGYMLHMYDEVPFKDVNDFVLRGHAAQMIYNLFDVNLNGSKDTFLKDLGYIEASKFIVKGDKAGHEYLAYRELNRHGKPTDNWFITDTQVSYNKTLTLVGHDHYKDGKKTPIRIDWSETKLYFDGKLQKWDCDKTEMDNEKVVGVFNEDDELISILYKAGLPITITPDMILADEIENEKHLKKIVNDKDYDEDTSTVSYNSRTGEYRISNDYVSSMIKYYRFIKDHTCKIILNNGDKYILNNVVATDFNTDNNFIVIYFDYEGEIAQYEIFHH